MLKKLNSYLLVFILAFSFSIPVFADTQPQISAKSAILINADNEQVLYAKDENTKRLMASTTKIMTALITLETAAVNNRIITITDKMVRVEGSSMGLLPGEKISLKSLAAGMLTVSGNDAANSAAIAISGTTEAFADLMNRRAQELNLKSTHFVTPSGLDDEQHYTTAHDLAILAAAAMKNPDFSEIAGQKLMNVPYVSPEQTRRLTNHNKMLSMYQGCIGVKTGFTKKAGRCLVSAAQRNGVRLIAVTLNAPDDWNDHQKLLDYGFTKLTSLPIDDSGYSTALAVVGGTSGSVMICGAAGSDVVVNSDDSSKIKRTVEMPRFVYAPVEAGQVVGSVHYTIDEKTIAVTELVAKEKVCQLTIQKNIFEIFLDGIKNLFMI